MDNFSPFLKLLFLVECVCYFVPAIGEVFQVLLQMLLSQQTNLLKEFYKILLRFRCLKGMTFSTFGYLHFCLN